MSATRVIATWSDDRIVARLAAHPAIDPAAQALLFEDRKKHEWMTAFLERGT